MKADKMRYQVVKIKNTFIIKDTKDNSIVEGGFFHKEAAEKACREWNEDAK